jgi:septum site-determining protein MinC
VTSGPVRASFDLKGTSLPLTAVVLKTTDLITLASDLEKRMAETPDFFDEDPVLIDLSQVRDDDAPINFDALIAVLRNHHMVPVAARGGGEMQMQAALSAGLTLASDVQSRIEMPSSENGVLVSAPGGYEPVIEIREVVHEVIREIEVPVGGAATLIIDKPLRSGQQVYARGADLVVLAAVSFGAEVMADGNIHVYAPLRGRALAGVQGDTSARIFTTCLEPQLISIAGIYRTSEIPIADEVAGKPAQVRLVGEKIVIDPL